MDTWYESWARIYENRLIRCLSFVTYFVLFAIHNVCMKSLKKPSGFAEAIQFLVKHPDKYFITIIASAIMCVIAFIIAVALVIELAIKSEDFRLIEYIISVVITLVMCVLSVITLEKTMILIIVVLFLGLIVYAIANDHR